ncbi:MAG: hypothetical protein AB7G37_07900 [Solirubrobacteraceae bacterium]
MRVERSANGGLLLQTEVVPHVGEKPPADPMRRLWFRDHPRDRGLACAQD